MYLMEEVEDLMSLRYALLFIIIKFEVLITINLILLKILGFYSFLLLEFQIQQYLCNHISLYIGRIEILMGLNELKINFYQIMLNQHYLVT